MTASADPSEIGAVIDVIGRWWEDPTITGLHRLPAHTVGVGDTDDRWLLDLGGPWAFRLVPEPTAAPGGWTTSGEDPAGEGWTSVEVPGCWTMQGVGDHPHYTNVVMPFPGDPPSVPAANPTGLYRTTFTLADDWRGRRTILHLGGAESTAAVWCNGVFVGITTDSRLPSELELTGVVHDGPNALAILVARWAASTWIEDQDHWHHGGLHRRVQLRSVAPTSLADVRVTAGLDHAPGSTGLTAGTLEVTARVDGPVRGHRLRTRLESLDGGAAGGSPAPAGAAPDGGAAGRPTSGDTAAEAVVSVLDDRDQLAAHLDAYRHPGPMATTSVTVDGVRPWSHEDPHRYLVVVDLVDADGEVVDRRRVPTGFRRVEIRGDELLLNGAPVLIAGVNRHDHHPTGGKTSTDDELRADVANIKRCGFNAVRTSHYPPDPVVLDACDHYGLWVVCEADVESHARWAELADDPRFTSAILERARRTVATHWNHPSIIGWSLGNEAGDGAVYDAGAAWVRRTDPSRFVQYEGSVMGRWRDGFAADRTATSTDIECPMYAPVGRLEEWATTTDRDRPLILCEYTHAMGNSNGGLADYWAAFERHPGLQGGFIWDWRDQGLVAVDEDGTRYHGYGGCFGDEPNDAAFCCNGVVGPDGTPHPAVEEHRWLTRPVRTRLLAVDGSRPDRYRLEVTNHRWFTGIGDLVGRARVEADGEEAARFDLPELEVAPGESVIVDIDLDLELMPDPELVGGPLLVTIEWRTRAAADWGPADHLVGWDQLPLAPSAERTAAASDITTPTLAAAPPAVGGRLAATVDPDSGLLTGLTVAGRSLLVEPPVLALWRAPTDNDGVLVGPAAGSSGVTRRWLEWGLDRLERATVDVTHEDDSIVTRHRWTSPSGVTIDHTQRMVVTDDSIRFVEDVVVPAELDDLPRVGIRFALAADLDQLVWLGPGPWETMPDRRNAPLGRWASTVADQYVAYVTPQHHGTHVDTAWFALTDTLGAGVAVETRGMAFDVSSYRVEDLTAAATTNRLRPAGSIQVHVDAELRGAGTGACGPDTEVIVGGGHHRFSWVLRPVEAVPAAAKAPTGPGPTGTGSTASVATGSDT
jgi:beta-galactosidase